MSSTERFTSRADAYAASRPWYPTAAIDAILAGFDPATLVVADLGAGTGISSRAIAGRGPRVLAIEPNAAMRGTAQPDPRIVWIDATAETTTLAEHSVDLAVAFQAWHWFDQAAVTAEVRRIARPGGRLAVAYNERSELDPFTAAYGAVVRRYATDETEQRRASALRSALGIDPDHTLRSEFVNAQTLDRAGVHARAESSSYLPQSGPAATAMHAEIDALFDRFAVTGAVRMGLVTTVVCIEL
jgi:SAM-dependent methyltransferase